mmetsp:Transcript_39029/g.91738  ORF Transcript_39029/g.91738 Transcript_39029/m.91738 type:complete len:259 (+) Transcript_39029:262-1038(+)
MAPRVRAWQRRDRALPRHPHAEREALVRRARQAAPSRGVGGAAAQLAGDASVTAPRGGPDAGRVRPLDRRPAGPAAPAADRLRAPLRPERPVAARVPERRLLQGDAGTLGAHRARGARHGALLGRLVQGLRPRVPAASLCALGADRAHRPRGDARQSLDRPARQLLAAVHEPPHLLQRLRVDPAAPALAPPVHQRLQARRRLPPLRPRSHLERAAGLPRATAGLHLQRGLDLRVEGATHYHRHLDPPAAAHAAREADA